MRQGLRLLFWLLVLAPCGAAQGTVATVITAGPGWSAGGRALERGTEIAVRTELTSSEAYGLLLECPSRWVSYTCRTPRCSVPACALTDEETQVQAVEPPVKSASAFITREARSPIIAASREGGNTNDAVVLHDGRGLHMGPALTRVLEGRYCLLLAPLPRGSAAATSFVLDWDRAVDPEGLLQAPDARPGLYSLSKGPGSSSGECQPDPDGVDAWVLVAPAGEYERVAAAWRSRLPTVAALEAAGADPSVVRTVRHATLTGIADAR